MPDGSTGKRQTAYDGVGNKSTVSEVMTGTPTNVTTFSGYDPFGRPTTITPPDGAAHKVTMAYHGVRQVDRTAKVGTTVGSETAATTTEIYDRQGRLYSVTEPSGSGGTLVTTTYGYDVAIACRRSRRRARAAASSTTAQVSCSPKPTRKKAPAAMVR